MTMLAMMAMTVGAQGFDNLPDPIEDVNKWWTTPPTR